jgi:hypothetical protein
LQYEYPEVPVPPGMTPQSRLTQLAWEGAAKRFPPATRDGNNSNASFETRLSGAPQDDGVLDGIKNNPSS